MPVNRGHGGYDEWEDSQRQQALIEAQSKARIILDRNLATRTYFSKIMKPSIFTWSEPFRTEENSAPTWMSSNYTIHEIEKYFKSFDPSEYLINYPTASGRGSCSRIPITPQAADNKPPWDLKFFALNARSHENEADEYERAFLEQLGADKKLESESTVRKIGGKPYLVVLEKGEVMEASCLRCHSNPKDAPNGLTDYYGSEKGFNRKEGDVVGAFSLRLPLSEAFAAANIFSLKLSAILLIVLACLFTIQYWFYRRYLLKLLNVIQEKATQIATHAEHLGEQISQPFGRELNELATAFNELSVKLRHDFDHLEELVDKRTEALRESEARYRVVTRSANDAIISADSAGTILSWNRGAEKVFGYTEAEISGQPLTRLLPCRYRDRHLDGMSRVHVGEEPHVIGKTVELEGLRKDMSEFPIELSLAEWETAEGRFYTAILRDITKRKRAEEKIQASLREKDILLSEIHHRVKNNLQVISGLLDLQAASSGNPELIEMFRESQSRIRSMALIHEKLYASKNFARIDLAGYARGLSQELFQSYKINPGEIDLIIQTGDDVYVDINKAIPCGLILNELISNALKYAFAGDGAGAITVSIRKYDDKEIEIVVCDNGLGLPDDVDIHQPRTVGLHLVNGLVKNQLDGQIEVRRDNGTEFRILFPL